MRPAAAIRNFQLCPPGFESRPNLKYWRCEEYLCFARSASYLEGAAALFRAI
jgi:hypothetical protein